MRMLNVNVEDRKSSLLLQVRQRLEKPASMRATLETSPSMDMRCTCMEMKAPSSRSTISHCLMVSWYHVSRDHRIGRCGPRDQIYRWIWRECEGRLTMIVDGFKTNFEDGTKGARAASRLAYTHRTSYPARSPS